MTPRRRWLLLGGLLVATVAAAWVEMESGDEAIAPARARPVQRAAAPSGMPDAQKPRLRLDKMKSRNPGESVRDPFAENATPAPRTAAPTSRRPAAPPQPFIFAGSLKEADGATAVFLMHGDRNLVVREGDTIDNTWRVELVEQDSITLVYLPLQERQVLAATDDSR